jgi:hypothetical protein
LARHGVALARRFSRNNNNNVKASSYASSLTPPCPDILSLESKVKSLLALGESVRASLVTVEFHVEEEKGEEEAQAEKEGEGGKDDPTPTLPVALLRRPVSLEVTMQVEGGTEPVGPTVNDAHRHHSLLLRPVRMQARGYATVAGAFVFVGTWCERLALYLSPYLFLPLSPLLFFFSLSASYLACRQRQP